MRSARLLLPAALASLFLLPTVSRAASIDQNNNGLDDVWETVFHAASLNPNADDDGDGFTNYQESLAGTDPLNAASHPPTVAITAAGANITLTWGTVIGKQYRLQTSPSTAANATWTNFGTPYAGTGANITATFGAAATTQYYRVTVGDLDSDGDGVSDWDELALGYDPYRADTFNTGFGDKQAITNALSAVDSISVTATQPFATTAFGDAGLLTFTRAGNLDAVTAAYTVGGTAVAGTDYGRLPGAVTFPVGINSVQVKVTPFANAAFATSRTVLVTLVPGASYQVSPDAAPVTVTLAAKPAATGQVVDESWDNLSGYNLDAVPFDTPAPRRAVLTSLEAPTNTGIDYYGSRIRGYITPPTTGAYTFWVAADDIIEFRLSSNDQMANLSLRAYTYSWTPSREWNKYPTQKSATLALVAGHRYAFEIKFFQGPGGDNLAVGWLKPGQTGTVPSEVVPGSALSAYVTPYAPPGATTLYFGALKRLAGAPTSAAGFANLRLAADNSLGVFSVSRSGLSGAATSLALHGPADIGQTGPVIAEFIHAPAQSDGTYLWNITDPAALAALKNGKIYASVATAANPGGELAGQLLRSAATGAFTPPAAPPALPAGKPTANDASRLLTQATFGPTNADLAVIQRDGYASWIDAQLAIPPTLLTPYMDAFATSGNQVSTDTFQEAWWKNALTAPDQLRQRVAFALSEILVVSDVSPAVGDTPEGMAVFYDILLRGAFGNYRQLIEDVTLNPVMGVYLNMLGNDKPDPSTGSTPNENYGREAMQLFSLGLVKLNPDGTVLLDSQSQPIPTYGQDEVEGFSHVYTGWTYAQSGDPGWDYVRSNYRQPMMLVPAHHDTAPKLLLDNVVLPAGQSGAQDLKDAMDMLANHPNVGPFLCRQLIQRLVTSNPSNAYVYRVAQVFANNGQGVRGDLRAVVRAILLDWEARAAGWANNTHYGKQREPIIRLANVYRAFNAHAYSGRFSISEYDTSPNYGQAPLDGPSVFNFFSPSYTRSGPIANAGLVCPEFQITTATTVVFSSNDLRDRIANALSTRDPGQIALDLTAQKALAASPAALVDSLNTLLFSGQMTSALRSQIIYGVASVDPADPLGRAQTAVQLLCTSPEFCIQK